MTRMREIKYFITVAEEGQMTAAARRLNLAQPALSQAIARLESQLGVELLERLPRGVALTPAGQAFLPKARRALDAVREAELTARAQAPVTRRMQVGYIGPPPGRKARELFAAFKAIYPHVDVSFHEMPFPQGSTWTWLDDVDVALCHEPAAESDVLIQPLRRERRTVLIPRRHPLAERLDLELADVLDQTFISYHPDVQPAWAGFHSLDDHRGGSPRSVTGNGASTPAEMLASIASRRGITTVPACDAEVIVKVLRGIAAIPLLGARPAMLSLTWRTDNHNPHVAALALLARSLESKDTIKQAMAARKARNTRPTKPAPSRGRGARS